MSEKENEKLESGNYVLVSKIRNAVQFWILIGSFLGGGVYLVQKDGLTFDSQKQKIQMESMVLENYQSIKEIRSSDANKEKRILIMEQAILNMNAHILDIKNGQEKMTDVQVKIGQDLQVLKNKK